MKFFRKRSGSAEKDVESVTPTESPAEGAVVEKFSSHDESTAAGRVMEAVGETNPLEGPASAEVALAPVKSRDEDLVEYPSTPRVILIFASLCLVVFLIALDQVILATAVPKITDEFHQIDDISWYVSAYLLTQTSFQPTFGKIYQYMSIKWTFLIAIGIFELGSLICGVAPSSVALIIGRAIAGLGASGLFSGGLTIIAYTIPLNRRPIFTGLIGAMFGISSVVAPLLGGVLTDHATWRWCFYINLPIGAFTIVVIFFFFKSPKRTVADMTTKEKIMQLDLVGAVFLLPGIICLLLALQWGGITYPWNDGRVIALLVVFAVLISIFVVTQLKWKDTATIPPRIIKQRAVASSSFTVFCVFSGFIIVVYYLPIYFQAVNGDSAMTSGIKNVPMLIAVMIGSVLGGGLTTAFGYYNPYILIGIPLGSIGVGLISTFAVAEPASKWIGYQVLAGIGVGLAFQQPLMCVQASLPLADVPVGTALVMFFQTLGGALFISVGQNLFQQNLVDNIVATAPGVDAATILSAGATQIVKIVPPDTLEAVLLAYARAIDKAFLIGAVMMAIGFIGAVFMPWNSVKGKLKAGVGAA